MRVMRLMIGLPRKHINDVVIERRVLVYEKCFRGICMFASADPM